MTRHLPLSGAIALALATVVASAAPPADAAGDHRPRASLDGNDDGFIDRAEAARAPRLLARFDSLDRDHDGRLGADERPRHGDRHGHGGRRHAGMGHAGMKHAGMEHAAAADADQDGRISRAEAAALPRMAGDFDAIDANRDGYVVRTELRAYHERMRPQREAGHRKRFEAGFAAADLDHDGKLSRVEVGEKMPRLLQAFAFMDDNRDGFLQPGELHHPRRR